jgi:thiamine biosynthesis lipoprotein
MVTIEVFATDSLAHIQSAIEHAFDTVRHISQVMNAHRPDSDLGKISRARAGDELHVSAHTVRVLACAQHWWQRSGFAFDPARSGLLLARSGARPGLHHSTEHGKRMDDLICTGQDSVRVHRPLALDLGGIAKGYAVDQALLALRQHGIAQARINAGGDAGVLGTWPQAMQIRHAADAPRDLAVGRQRRHHGAVATSVADPVLSEFVRTGQIRRSPWRSATVWARDCMTADALTKWALQSSPLCPALRGALRTHGATLLRSR